MTHLPPFQVVVVVVRIANNYWINQLKETFPMKRVTIAVFTFVVLLALTAPLALAGQDEPPPTPDGGCTGAGCR